MPKLLPPDEIDALVAKFRRDGYLLIENYFPADEMDRLNALIMAHFGEAPEFWHTEEFLSRAKTEVVPWFPLWDNEPAFAPIAQDPTLVALTDRLLGEGWDDRYCMVMFSRRGSRGQAWHQDCAPEDPAVFNINRLVYTADVTAEIGGQIALVPGSHLRGELPPDDPDAPMEGELVMAPSKGSLILLHGHTWHKVLPVTGGTRSSTNYRAAPKGAPQDLTDICVYRNMRYCFATKSVIEDRLAISS